MVVAVIAVRVMQVPVDQIVYVVAVRDRRMSTIFAVDVVCVVTLAVVLDASVGVAIRDFNDVLVVVALVGAVKVAIMQVAYVVLVFHSDVAAVRAVLVIVVFVDIVTHLCDLQCR